MSIKTLGMVAAIGGFICSGTGYYFYYRIQNSIMRAEYFKKSIEIFTEHKGVCNFLGKPIKFGRLNLSDNKRNFCDGIQAQFEVPVYAKNYNGTLYLSASRPDYYSSWTVNRLELELSHDNTKRILMWKS